MLMIKYSRHATKRWPVLETWPKSLMIDTYETPPISSPPNVWKVVQYLPKSCILLKVCSCFGYSWCKFYTNLFEPVMIIPRSSTFDHTSRYDVVSCNYSSELYHTVQIDAHAQSYDSLTKFCAGFRCDLTRTTTIIFLDSTDGFAPTTTHNGDQYQILIPPCWWWCWWSLPTHPPTHSLHVIGLVINEAHLSVGHHTSKICSLRFTKLYLL